MEQEENSGFRIISDYDCIGDKEVFAKLLSVLMAYAYTLIGNNTLRLSKSREDLAYDFSMEAIGRHLEVPNNFDPRRNKDLVAYLKFNILKRLVSNFRKTSGQKNEIGYEVGDSIAIKAEQSFIKANDIHDLIDLQKALELLHQYLQGNTNLLEIFDLRYTKEYTRAEVCAELQISSGEYANRIRRLETVLNRVRKQQAEKNE